MALDEFIIEKLNSMARNFDALTERLADPDISANRQQMLALTRERAAVEPLVSEFMQWKSLETERLQLLTMEDSAKDDMEMMIMVRDERNEILAKQADLEKKLMVLLLPTDPNDAKNVMLEIRAGIADSR